MSIPENSTPKNFTLIIYDKTEIDVLNQTEQDRVNTELDKKVNTQMIGSPVGLGTLDVNGKQSFSEVSFATSQDASEGTSSNKSMTPELVKQEINSAFLEADNKFIELVEKGSADGVASLDFQGEVYPAQIPDLPYIDEVKEAQPLGIATLDANGKLVAEQLPVGSSVGSYYVATINDMLALTGINQGDRCIVHNNVSDPSKEGEYVALLDAPVLESDWGKVPVSNAVTSVNGQAGSVNITSIDESAQNKIDISTLNTSVGNNATNISANATSISTNASDIALLEPKVDDNASDIIAVGNVTNLTIQTGVSVDEITGVGIYEVDTDLPNGWTFGEMLVQHYVNNISVNEVLQVITNIFTGEKVERTAPDYTAPVWNTWTRVIQDAQETNVLTFKDQTTTPDFAKGIMYYEDGTHKLRGKYHDVTLDVGKEQWIDVVNSTGTAILNGTPVRLNGISAGLPQIVPAIADTFENARVFGMATHDIAAGETGIVTTFGSVGDVDTNAFTLNDSLFLSDTVVGGLTKSAPAIVTLIGVVTEIGATGTIFCKPQNNMSLPNALSFIKGKTMPNLSLNQNSPTEIVEYESELSVYGTNDITAGTVRVNYAGVYTLSMQLSGTFSDEEVPCNIDLYDKTNLVIIDDINFTVGRGASANAVPMSQTFNTVVRLAANTDYIMRFTSSTNETLSDLSVSFGVTSVHLDF